MANAALFFVPFVRRQLRNREAAYRLPWRAKEGFVCYCFDHCLTSFCHFLICNLLSFSFFSAGTAGPDQVPAFLEVMEQTCSCHFKIIASHPYSFVRKAELRGGILSPRPLLT